MQTSDEKELFAASGAVQASVKNGKVIKHEWDKIGKKKGDISPVISAYDAQAISKADSKIGKYMGIFGTAQELLYASDEEKPKPKSAVIMPQNCVLVRDNTIERRDIFFMVYERRGELNGRKYYAVTVYTDKTERYYEWLSSGRVKTAISESWNGKNYSERIWSNTEQTAGKLREIVIKGIMTGQPYADMEQALTATLGMNSDSGARFKASRLIRTEVNYISDKATTKAYRQAEIEEYVFLATLDKKTCHDCGNGMRKSCAELDGKRFKVSEAKVGVNKRPMHPFCRCSDYPYISGRKTVRAARDENGKSIRVDGDMTYEQWYEKFVDNSDENGIINIGSEKMTISSIEKPIEFPIEQRNTGKGNPNAILIFDVELNNRQKELLKALPNYDSKIIVKKTDVNMKDLSALTAVTGVEFAMFTKGSERLIIRGNATKVNIGFTEATLLSKHGYRWSGHTHPGTDKNCSMPSSGDKEILKCFKQNESAIYDSKGQYRTFEKE